MTGFKNFLLRGNLIELAVAFIMATAFGLVVQTFTAWILGTIPGLKSVFDNSLGGQFGNSLVAFVVIAAVVYFGIVVPYIKARARFFPAEAEGTPEDVALLTEIRDLLAQRGGQA
jgi:large conductance mechanosensitive channel